MLKLIAWLLTPKELLEKISIYIFILTTRPLHVWVEYLIWLVSTAETYSGGVIEKCAVCNWGCAHEAMEEDMCRKAGTENVHGWRDKLDKVGAHAAHVTLARGKTLATFPWLGEVEWHTQIKCCWQDVVHYLGQWWIERDDSSTMLKLVD